MVDDLLDQARTAAAILLGPVDAHPASVVQLAVPGAATLELFQGVGVVQFVVPPVAGDIVFEPASEFLSKGFVFRAEFEIHA